MRHVARWSALAALVLALLAVSPPDARAEVVAAHVEEIATAASTAPAAAHTATAATSAVAVLPRYGEGLISLTARTCGTAATWRAQAAANRVHGPSFVIYLGRAYTVACTRTRTAATASRATASRPTTRATTSSTRARTVIAYALAQTGKYYCWAGSGPRCFDCSGLVMASFARIGVRLPHQSGQMLAYGTRISRSQLRPGDIVWPQWGHVAIYLGNNRIVHAANQRQDVLVSNLYGFYAARRVIR